MSEKDPVCAMVVDPALSTLHSTFHGKTYHFCGPSCLKKFEADPEKYLKPRPPAAPLRALEMYTCPMHPEVRQRGPGSCPKCGMALEPVHATEDENPELIDMQRRFRVAIALTVPFLALMVSDVIPGRPLQQIVSPRTLAWIQLLLA